MTFIEFALSDKTEERQKREQRAASAECTPVSISVENQCGVFSGKSGVYNTRLEECECRDFERRGYPCKHMYRLAYELGQYKLEAVEADSAQIKKRITPTDRAEAFEKNVALIEAYSMETQLELQGILRDRYRNTEHVCSDFSVIQAPLSDGLIEVVNNPTAIIECNTQKQTVESMLSTGFLFPEEVRATKKARYEWCLQNADMVCSRVYPNWRVVRVCGTLETAYKKTYTYLNRKFEDIYW